MPSGSSRRRQRRRRSRNDSSIKRSIHVSPVSVFIIVVLCVCFFLKLSKVRQHHSKTLNALFPKSDTEEQLRVRPLACPRFMKSIAANTETKAVSAVRRGHSSTISDPNHGQLILAHANVSLVFDGKTDTIYSKAKSISFLVSIHRRVMDAKSKGWSIMRTGKYYQTKTTQLMIQILTNQYGQHHHGNYNENNHDNSSAQNYYAEHNNEQELSLSVATTTTTFRPARVMDVGASFGWYSLLAYKLGYQVDVFEPNLVNVIRICQSLEQNQWITMNHEGNHHQKDHHDDENENSISSNNNNDDTYTHHRPHHFEIYPYGMTMEDSTVLFQYKEDGTARINDNWGHKSQAFALDTFARERGWLERNDEIISVLKIDVGHHAPQVLLGATELLESGMVKFILLDLNPIPMRHNKGDVKKVKNSIQQLIHAGFGLELWGPKEHIHPNEWEGKNNPNNDLPTNIINSMMEEPSLSRSIMSFLWKYNKEE